MNLTVFAGILLAVIMATARGASLKTMQAATEADEPEEAMREEIRPASLVEKIMRAADEADEPAGVKRANGAKKKEIKAKMADEDEEDEAESGEVHHQKYGEFYIPPPKEKQTNPWDKAKKKEIKAKMADEDEEDAESREVHHQKYG